MDDVYQLSSNKAADATLCDHQYVFLREETKNEGYPRNPERYSYDIFYCAKCLNYQVLNKRRLYERGELGY